MHVRVQSVVPDSIILLVSLLPSLAQDQDRTYNSNQPKPSKNLTRLTEHLFFHVDLTAHQTALQPGELSRHGALI